MIIINHRKKIITGGVNPLDYSPDFWHDASDPLSITLDATGKVIEWADKSGNGNHLTQGSANRRPYYNNGKVEFNTDSDTHGLESPHLAQTATHTWMFCLECYNLVETNAVAAMIHHGTSDTLILAFGVWSSTLLNARVAYHDGSSYRYTDFAAPLNEKMVLVYELKATTDIYYNNTLIGDALQRSNQVISTNLRVYGNRAFYNARFRGAFYELMYFNRTLSSNDREMLTNYMLAK
jgi:hypothetical protein